jgi:hypothetical protein
MPRKIALGALATIVAFAVLLAAAAGLVRATMRVAQIASTPARIAAAGGELILGAAALLAAVYIATHLAVRVFANHAPEPRDPAPPSQLS